VRSSRSPQRAPGLWRVGPSLGQRHRRPIVRKRTLLPFCDADLSGAYTRVYRPGKPARGRRVRAALAPASIC